MRFISIVRRSNALFFFTPRYFSRFLILRLIRSRIGLALSASLLLLLLPSCAARSRFSQGGREHLTRALQGRRAVLKNDLIPQNKHGISLALEKQFAGTEISIGEVVIAPGWSGIGFTTATGRTVYLSVGATDVRTFESELSRMVKWLPIGDRDSSEAYVWLSRTGHIHPPDHLVVIRSGTPLLPVPEPNAPIKGTLIGGDRLSINYHETRTDSGYWFPVMAGSGDHGWVSSGLVCGPVYLNGPEDLELSEILPDGKGSRSNLDRLLTKSINEAGLEIDPGAVSAWPWEVKAAVYRHEVLPGMTPEMTRLSLGPPSGIDTSGEEEVWRYNRAEGGVRLIYFRNGRIHRIGEGAP